MNPRTASLRVAHQQNCVNANRSALDSLDGCTCKPSYFVFRRDTTGAVRKGKRVRDRRVAERELRAVQVTLDEGRHEALERQQSIPFPEWVDVYRAQLADRVRMGDLAPATERLYAQTLAMAVDAIGHVDVRQIGAPQLRKFYGTLEKLAPASRARHLRELGACLSAAVDDGYADANPMQAFRRKLRLKVPKRGTDPYTDEELPRLWEALRNGDGADTRTRPDRVYLAIFRAAVTTGARISELIAADWTDLDLSAPSLHLWRQWSGVDGFQKLKDREARTLDLTPAAVKVLGEWIAEVGVQTEGPIFTGPNGARLNADYCWRVLERARKTAGIPKLGQTGLKRTVHALRDTYTRQMLEQGRHPQWVQAQLGHSGVDLTLNTYGQWSAEAMRAEASKVPENLPGI